MELQKAIDLINFSGVMKTPQPMYWADLGCGSGTFSTALSYLLPMGSHIKGIDIELQRLFDEPKAGVSIDFYKADFRKDRLPLPAVDGFLMANSLHFVEDKKALIEKLRHLLKPQHYWLIVEYDTQAANTWVPYPISFNALKVLFSASGYTDVRYLRHTPSKYGHGNIYACLITSS